MKIGIYGGTFNPPHLGHLTAAAAVIATLKLDKLLLIPASIPPHKDLPAGSATAEQRLEMTRMAGEQLGLGGKVETLDMEVRRAGKSFTSDTLAELKAQFPEDELWLLMGTDMFLSFETWHEPEKIASLAGIAAFGRTKADMEPQFSAQRDKLYRLYPDARIFTLTVPFLGQQSTGTFGSCPSLQEEQSGTISENQVANTLRQRCRCSRGNSCPKSPCPR